MTSGIVLASGSKTRRKILEEAGISLVVEPARVDEQSYRQSLEAEGASPLSMATALAEIKSRRVSHRHPQNLTIGCDQILEFEGKSRGKAADMSMAREFLWELRGHTHQLHSAAVICQDSQPVWRSVSTAHVTFRHFSDTFLENYLQNVGPEILSSVGGYQIEGQGIRLIANLRGDIYAVLGLPMIQLLGYLVSQGAIDG